MDRWFLGWYARYRVWSLGLRGEQPFHANEVLPGLWIGGLDDAFQRESLVTRRITHVCCVMFGVPPLYEQQFAYHTADIVDDTNEDLVPFLEPAIRFIETALQSGEGGVLVHCNVGRSRSVAITVAYLMQSRQMTLDAALELIRCVRPSAQPNQAFIEALQRYAAALVQENENAR